MTLGFGTDKRDTYSRRLDNDKKSEPSVVPFIGHVLGMGVCNGNDTIM